MQSLVSLGFSTFVEVHGSQSQKFSISSFVVPQRWNLSGNERDNTDENLHIWSFLLHLWDMYTSGTVFAIVQYLKHRMLTTIM